MLSLCIARNRGLAGDVHTVDNTHPWLDGMGWLQRF